MEKKNVVQRVISGIVLAVLLFGTCFLGGIAWYLFSLAIAAGGIYEFYKLYGLQKSPEGFVGYAFTVSYWLLILFGRSRYLLPLLILSFLIEMTLYVFRFTKSSSEKALASVFGLIYPVVMASYLYFVRRMDHGFYLTLLVFAGSWGADVFAWLVGTLIGKHHLPTAISPKKTWEGILGGIVGSGLLGLIFGLVIGAVSDFTNPALICTLLAAASAVVSIIGDLTASAFKRHHGVKDYSKLIPGHGGVLDRFDSVLFVAPVIYYGSILLARIFA